ncbi:MAG: YicC/YloC family endoribonuclease [Alphaproteobacteria bacterium]
MSVASMTGFARAAGQRGALSWSWELKSVNARSFDVRFRLPPGLDHLEVKARAALTARLHRGNLTAQLSLTGREEHERLTINEAMLEQLLALHARYGSRVDPSPPRLEGLLAVRGVVEPAVPEPESPGVVEEREAAMLASLDEAVAMLVTMRRAEGERLLGVLSRLLDEIDRLRAEAERSAAARPEAIMARLRTQMKAMLDAQAAMPEERIVQEAALLAVKADVREELDRLSAHVVASRDLLREGTAIGRRLDFLCQEFNREANTLCSKAGDAALIATGLKLKAVIEQFREQVQNIE